MNKPKFPISVKRGSITVKIYETPNKGFMSFTISYWTDGKRKRKTFSNFKEAKKEAENVAAILTRGSDHDVLELRSHDRASYLRARQVLGSLGIPLESVASDYVTAKKILGDVSIQEAAEFYRKKHPTKLPAKTVKEIIQEMLELKKQDGLNPAYLRHLSYDLGQFSSTFNCFLYSVTGSQIDAWLRSLSVSPRTRNNLRTSVHTLFSFAKSKKYIPKDHDELESVGVAKIRSTEIAIYKPSELSVILERALPSDLAFIVLAAFAGIRHSEIQRLTWKEIDLESRIIEITAGKAKTGSRRTVPILPNLESWLKHLPAKSGLVCDRKNMSDSFRKLSDRIRKKDNPDFQWKRNALRHSFISYRVAKIQNVAQVALEAGNSPQIIFSNYRELVSPKEATAWFNIHP